MNCPKCLSPKIWGHEIPSVYDGVAYWACEDCGHQWHRFESGYYVRTRLEVLRPEIAAMLAEPKSP